MATMNAPVDDLRARRIRGASILCICAVTTALCSPAHARDVVVTSFDGTRLVAHFYPAVGQAAGVRAPTVLAGPSYPQQGDRRPDLDASDRVGAASLRAAGYNVLTWDPRGLGGSGGTAMFNSPQFEGRDVSALIDFVAAQPEALLDAPRDPRVGMSGSSYGGGIQFVSAAIDARIDAIVPDIAWHSLLTSVFRDGAVKARWLSAICAGGEIAALTGGIFFSGGSLQLGATATELKRVCVEGLVGGAISGASRQWLADRGPSYLVNRIRAPTLITQGTVDTLFALGEAIANYDVLRRNDVPVKMLWYCGGHGECLTPSDDPRHVARAGLAWFARWLKRDPSVDTGPRFEWLADDLVWRAAPDYPLAHSGTLDASGTGKLELLPLDGISTRPVAPLPPRDAVNVAFASPPSTSDVIGEPLVKLTYRGKGVPRRTFLYAQIIDGGRVVGGQATPIPMVLDGRTQTVQRALETVALRVKPTSNLRLQVTSGSPLYDPQRSVGSVRLQSIEASLPLVDAIRSARPTTAAVARRTPPRLQIRITARRRRGNIHIELRSRLRARPCSGTVLFTMRSDAIRRAVRAAVTPTCAIRARLRVRARRSYRVSALFEGNDRLTPRRAHSTTRRVP